MLASDEELAAHARSRVGAWLREKYRIDRVLGIGGMGAVYGATHRNGRQVAIKLLHSEYAIRPDLRRRFLREGQAANAVNHPGVVAIIDDDVTDEGAAFLVMELLDGQSVEQLWEANGKRLPTKAVLTLAADLCAVLAVAHDAGVIHRDLKPANRFVTRTGELKVLDFGIARVREVAATSATSTGAVFGTPSFMPPEQAGGLVNELGPHTDLWAVGATMYTLLSGHPVHDGQSGQHIAILAATCPAPSLAAVLPEAPKEVVAVVDRALAFDKADRWPSAEAMRAALCEALSSFDELETVSDATVVRGTLSETMLAVAGVKPIAPRSATLRSAGARDAFLGGTTGQPVSSGAITEVERTSTWERALAAIRRWWSRPGYAGPDVPVSSDAPTQRRSPKSRVRVAVALVALTTIATGVFITVEQHAARSPERAESSQQILEASGAPIVALPPAAPASGSVPTPPSSSSSASEQARQQASPSVRVVKTPAARPHPVTTATPPRLNCNPPFTVEDGIQVHKPGCP